MNEKAGKVICLKGEKVILRPFDIATDFELFIMWINDPEVVKFLLRIIPVYRHQQLAWFQNLPNLTDIIFTIETVAGNIIGMIGFERVDLINGTAWTWQIIGEKQHRRKGFGTEAKFLLLDYGFNTLRLEKVCSEVLASNTSSLRYNEKCGFREEGRLKNHVFREGARQDLIMFGILKEEFFELQAQDREVAAISP